jgi:MFS family permease
MSKRLPTKFRVILLGIALSALGNGLVLPYLFIYLHNIRGISSALAGLIIGYGALASLAISPLVGNMIDHWGPKPVLLISLLVSAVGYSAWGTVHHTYQAFVVITICSFGQSAMWPAQNAIATELTPDHLRERAYGSSFAVLNLGLGVGGLISSLVVSLKDPHSFQHLFVGDGFSFLLYFLVVLTLRNVGHRNKAERAANKKLEGGWKDVLADRTFVKFWLVSLAAIFFGYSQLEVGFAAFSTSIARQPPAHIAWAYAANTLVIATCQLWVIKRIEKLARAKAMAIATVLWMGSWIALSLAGLISGLGLAMVILCQVIFAFGEMFWSPVVPSIVNQLAPDHLRGRYNAASSNAWQIALVMGPTMAGTLLGAGLHWLWIALLVTGLFVVTVLALRLKLPSRVVDAASVVNP